MTTRFDKQYSLQISREELAERLRNADFARERLESGKRLDEEVLFHGSSEQGIRIVTRAQMHKSDLPAWMASRFPDGGPVNEREEVWIDGSELTARVEVRSLTRGATFTGVYSVVNCTTGSTWRIQGTASFRNIFIGKSVEAFMLKSLDIGFARESAFLNQSMLSNGELE